MKRYGSIYVITNLITNKQYVGQTKNNVLNRFSDHCRDKRSSRYLSSSIKKYGREHFKIEELMVCFDKTSLNKMETYFIEKFNTLTPSGYNLNMGESRKGEISDLTRQKMSQAKIGKTVKRNKKWSESSRLRKSREQNGKAILAISLIDGSIKKYDYINQAEKDGFNNSEIYRVLKNKRKSHKNHTFKYINQANQSGSLKGNIFEHAQRIGFEPVKTE